MAVKSAELWLFGKCASPLLQAAYVIRGEPGEGLVTSEGAVFPTYEGNDSAGTDRCVRQSP